MGMVKAAKLNVTLKCKDTIWRKGEIVHFPLPPALQIEEQKKTKALEIINIWVEDKPSPEKPITGRVVQTVTEKKEDAPPRPILIRKD